MSWKDLFVTDIPEAASAARSGAKSTEQVKKDIAPVPPAALNRGWGALSVAHILRSPTPVVSDDDPSYKRLLAATDLKSMQAFAQLEAHEKPLEKVIPDKATRLRAAAAMVASSVKQDDGQFKQSLLSSFDELINRLEQEKVNFSAYAEAQMQEQVKKKEFDSQALDQDISKAENELNRLKNRKSQLQSEAAQAKEKIEKVTRGFGDALDRRRGEIENERAEYIDMLESEEEGEQ